MIRARQLGSLVYSSGNISTVQLPRDSVYHLLRLSCFGGSFSTVQGAMGTGPTLVPGFPFSLMRQVRLIRNGSDVVFSASGEQLAKHHYYLNKSHPQARLYTVSSNVETLRTATVRGVTIPANAQGIGSNQGGFTVPDAPAGTGTVNFDCQVDLWLQLGVDDGYFSTLLDARPLASYDLEITWASEAAQIAAAGTANTSNSASVSFQVLSLDQDNVKVDAKFGTYKRSNVQISNFAYGSENNQVLLPRGNFFYGIQLGTKAYKSGSSTVPVSENSVISTITNRINSNLYLRTVDFRQLQADNLSDFGGRQSAWDAAEGCPQGFAQLNYVNAGQKMSELVTSYAMDQFDLQLSIRAQGSATNGATSNNTNPVIDLMYEEVIPGVGRDGIGPQGAAAGSIARTSSQPRR